MDNISYKVWTSFYQEFANKLMGYKDNRKELIEIIKRVYVDTNIKMPTLEKDNNIIDIDPFTVFWLFNKGITNQNRTSIITAFANILGISLEVPTDFDGIPVLNNMAATFYWFEGDRGVDDIQNLWNVFESSINYADEPSDENKKALVKHFDVAANQRGVKWNLTFGMYWSRPFSYINLDGLNRAFLTNEENGMSDALSVFPKLAKGYFPSGEQYIEISEKCKKLIASGNFEFKNLPEMSHLSWVNKPETLKEDKEEKLSKANFLKWFAPLIQALKDLGGSGTPKEAIAKIAENENVDDETLNQTRGKSGMKKFDNEVNWARNYLVYAGIVDKSKRGVWALTEKGKEVEMTEELASQIFRKKWWVDTEENEPVLKKRYWIYGYKNLPWEKLYNEGIITLDWDELEDFSDYSSKEDIRLALYKISGEEKSYKNDIHAIWQFANDMNIGDIVYIKNGLFDVVGRGVIESDYIYDETKLEQKSIRKVKWTHKGKWEHPGQAVAKILTDITQYTEYATIMENLFSDGEEISIDDEVITYPPYTKENFLSQVFMNSNDYETVKNLLLRKKNIILQGAPGVGKTFAAKKLAHSIMGEKDDSRIEMLQFHQSYSYEDFIMGYRPDNNGFKLHYGAFYKFCKKAQDDNERDYFFIIDEINRGNLSKIFGELFMLVEHDKRNERNSMRLVYADEQFYIPPNVHIIGMMNTADRSLAMLDYALRRRFAFYEMHPAFDSDGFKKYQENINNPKFNRLIEEVKRLNSHIKEDVSLGAGFRIGHSYFIKAENDVIDDTWLNTVVNYEIIPLLQEYWFDESSKVEEYSQKLQEAIL